MIIYHTLLLAVVLLQMPEKPRVILTDKYRGLLLAVGGDRATIIIRSKWFLTRLLGIFILFGHLIILVPLSILLKRLSLLLQRTYSCLTFALIDGMCTLGRNDLELSLVLALFCSCFYLTFTILVKSRWCDIARCILEAITYEIIVWFTARYIKVLDNKFGCIIILGRDAGDSPRHLGVLYRFL